MTRGLTTKNLLMIAYDFPPRGGSGVQRTVKFAKYLAEFGWEVTVACPDWSLKESKKDDPGLGCQVSTRVRVETLGAPAASRFSSMWQLLHRLPRGWKYVPSLMENVSYPDHAGEWGRRALMRCMDLAKAGNYDVIYSTSPPVTTHWIGLQLKQRLGLPWVADFRDPWSNTSSTRQRLWRWRKRIDHRLEQRVYNAADRIVANTTANRLNLLHGWGLPDAKVVTIPNGFDEEDFVDCEERPLNRFRVCYAGAAYDGYNPDAVVKAFQLFVQNVNPSDAVLSLAGTCCEWAVNHLDREWLARNVELLGYLPHDQIASLLAGSYIVATANPTGTPYWVPGKVYELLRSQRHMLAVCDAGSEVESLVKKTKSGSCFPAGDIEAMAQYLQQLYNDWKAGRSARPGEQDVEAINQFDRRRLTRHLAEVLEEAISETAVSYTARPHGPHG